MRNKEGSNQSIIIFIMAIIIKTIVRIVIIIII